MLYRPIRLTPDVISIDSTLENIFSCVIDGDTCDAYRLIIYNATTSVEVFNSGKITISPIKYGGDTVTHSLTAETLTNGINYTYVFKLYEGVTEVTSRITLFYANTTPVTTLTFTNPIVSQKISLQATYTQAQGIGMSEYTYTIKSGDKIISEYKKMGTQDTRFTLSGLIGGSEGFIEFSGITQRGQAFTTGDIPYSVQYLSPSIKMNPVTTMLYDSKVNLAWGKAIQMEGSVDGDYDYYDNFIRTGNKGIHLKKDSVLKYDVTFGEEYTLKFKLNLNTGFNGKICEQIDTTTGRVYEFGFEDNVFYWKNDGFLKSSFYIPKNLNYTTVFILPQMAYIKAGQTIYEIKS